MSALVTRAQILECARSWIGTPFDHQGQCKGVGCDCRGLIAGVPAELGMPEAQTLVAQIRDYPTHFSGRRLFAGLCEVLIRVPEPRPADVLAIMIGRDPMPRHLAFLTETGGIIHTYGGGVNRVAETPLGHWRVHSSFTWPSLAGE